MVFSQNIDASYKFLKDGIETVSQADSQALSFSIEDGYPLIVMETQSDAVGFATVNGAPTTSFDKAYRSFKNLYRNRHYVWRELNLSFVLCRLDPDREHDAFFSALETDVYFCRKYVVFLSDDMDQLQQELLRLPFFPLPEGHKGGVVRPATAQSFLQSSGVNAQVARQIVVPREYSANRMAMDLIRAGESLPSLKIGERTEGFKQDGPEKHTRIKKVCIEAFRAYKQKQVFDVDADVVVLYGPNGLGKTSFFDAIDYACTGRIGRLYRNRMSQADFKSIARHLGVTANTGSVSIELLKGDTDAPVLLSRSLNDWSHASVGLDQLKRSDTLQFLTSAKWGEKPSRIENLERLFRATHLFSQSTPELLIEFEEDSTISFDLVSRMLALDDYAAALKKIDGVMTELNRRSKECSREYSDLDNAITEIQKKAKALQGMEQTQKVGDQLQEIATVLIGDLQSEFGINIDRKKVTMESAREWRAMVESAIQNSADDAALTNKLAADFAVFDHNRESLLNVTSKITGYKSKLSQMKPKAVQDKKQLQELLKTIEAERLVLKQSEQREVAFTELVRLRDQFKKAERELLQAKNIGSETGIEIESLVGQIKSHMSKIEEQKPCIERLLTQIQTTEGSCHRLETIRSGFQTWNDNRTRISELEKNLSKGRKTLESLNNDLKALTLQQTETKQELVVSEQAYANLSVGQEKLTGLLDQIEAFVESNICPTCGSGHDSKEILIKRIHQQKMTRPIQIDSLATRCNELRIKLVKVQDSCKLKEQEKQDKIKERDRISKELSETGQLIAAFKNQIIEAGLSIDNDFPHTLTEKYNMANEKLQNQQIALKKAETQIAETRQKITVLETKQKEQLEVRKKAELSVASLEQTIKAYRAEAQSLNLSVEMKTKKIEDLMATTRESRIASEQRLSELSEHREKLERVVSASIAQVEELRASLQSQLKRQSELQAIVQSYRQNAISFLKAEEFSEDAVDNLKRSTQERSAHLEFLRKRCLSLERSLDANQRSAALVELHDEIRNLEKHRSSVSERAKQEKAARKWSDWIKAALEKQSSSAVEDHVNSLGPLATLIQQRLRAVYGFGDVSLVAKKGEIRVQVEWGHQHYKPAQYFSDSQKQILMLSIFLSGRLTQTWSGFAPILLDDPVTHFDDLNAFGFVELIRGLVTTLPGKRQFFISTCEDRLFELMRKKFSGIAGGARFYRFSGIGVDGPVVEKIG